MIVKIALITSMITNIVLCVSLKKINKSWYEVCKSINDNWCKECKKINKVWLERCKQKENAYVELLKKIKEKGEFKND